MNTESKKLYRSRTNVDPTIVRLLFAAGAIFSGGLLLLLYLVMIFIVPEAPMA